MTARTQVQIGEMFNNWKVIETNIVNPDSQTKEATNDIWSKVQCNICKERERILPTNKLKKISLMCNACAIRERNNLNRIVQIGQKYGKLTVTGDGGVRPYGVTKRHYAICDCDCGAKDISILDQRLLNGKISCGCERSRGEYLIEQLLKKNNLLFNTEFVFPLLVQETGRRLRFDFVLYNEDGSIDRFVEFDGDQHHKGMTGGIWSKGDSLTVIQERDKIKDNFCLEHDYLLIRIPYKIKEKVTIEDILSDKYAI